MPDTPDNVTEFTLPKTEHGNDPADNHSDQAYQRELVTEFEKRKQEVDRKRESRSPFIMAKDFDLTRGTEFLIDDYWCDEGITLLYAPKDHYKSFLTAGWACSVASGKPWNGAQVTKSGPVVYIAGEGSLGLQRRIEGWCIHNGYKREDLPLALGQYPMQILDLNSILAWQTYIQDVVDQVGPLAGIVIDTLSSNFGPGDENHPSDMARFLAHINIYLTGFFDCPSLVVHHTGKDASRGARGGSSLTANCEEVYTLERIDNDGKKVKPDAEDQGTIVQLVGKHVKDREAPPTTALKAHVQELGIKDSKGREISTLVLKPCLTPYEMQVKNLTARGISSREIAAEMTGTSHNTVSKAQRKLAALGLLK